MYKRVDKEIVENSCLKIYKINSCDLTEGSKESEDIIIDISPEKIDVDVYNGILDILIEDQPLKTWNHKIQIEDIGCLLINKNSHIFDKFNFIIKSIEFVSEKKSRLILEILKYQPSSVIYSFKIPTTESKNLLIDEVRKGNNDPLIPVLQNLIKELEKKEQKEKNKISNVDAN